MRLQAVGLTDHSLQVRTIHRSLQRDGSGLRSTRRGQGRLGQQHSGMSFHANRRIPSLPGI
jgi:hypothetical protein